MVEYVEKPLAAMRSFCTLIAALGFAVTAVEIRALGGLSAGAAEAGVRRRNPACPGLLWERSRRNCRLRNTTTELSLKIGLNL